MASVTYTAKRNISSGHTLSTQYTMDFTMSRADRRHNVYNRQSESLNGTRETLRYYGSEFYDITVNEIEHADLPLWREFIESVDGGETFTIDIYGTEASPDNPVTATLESNYYAEQRIQTTLYYNISFRVRIE